MNYYKMLLFITWVFSHSSFAYASNVKEGLYILPSVHYNFEVKKESQTQWKNNTEEMEEVKSVEKTIIYNLNINYHWQYGFVLGLKYWNESIKSNNSGTTNMIETKGTTTGLNLGYVFGNFYLGASTFVLGTPKLENENYTLSGGGGLAIDFIYLIKIKNWFIGPQLTYITQTYKVRQYENMTTEDENYQGETKERVIPFFSIMIKI